MRSDMRNFAWLYVLPSQTKLPEHGMERAGFELVFGIAENGFARPQLDNTV
jgi:hypothetical protein